MYLNYAKKKIETLTIVFPFMTLKQRKTLLKKAYFMSQFVYYPLVWMNHSRSLNNRINTLHEIALRLVYNDFTSDLSNYTSKKSTKSGN